MVQQAKIVGLQLPELETALGFRRHRPRPAGAAEGDRGARAASWQRHRRGPPQRSSVPRLPARPTLQQKAACWWAGGFGRSASGCAAVSPTRRTGGWSRCRTCGIAAPAPGGTSRWPGPGGTEAVAGERLRGTRRSPGPGRKESLASAWRNASLASAWRNASLASAWRNASLASAWRNASLASAWRNASLARAWRKASLARRLAERVAAPGPGGSCRSPAPG